MRGVTLAWTEIPFFCDQHGPVGNANYRPGPILAVSHRQWHLQNFGFSIRSKAVGTQCITFEPPESKTKAQPSGSLGRSGEKIPLVLDGGSTSS